MSQTLIRWTPEEEAALARIQARMQQRTPGESVTRPDVIRELVRKADTKREERT